MNREAFGAVSLAESEFFGGSGSGGGSGEADEDGDFTSLEELESSLLSGKSNPTRKNISLV